MIKQSSSDGYRRATGITVAGLALAATALAGCTEPEVDGASSELSARAARMRQTAADFVAAQKNAGHFVPSSGLLANGDGFIILDGVNDDFTTGELGAAGSLFDGNDWLRFNPDGSATIHVSAHDASMFYFDLARGADAFSDGGGNLAMDFTGQLLRGAGLYYIDFDQPITRLNFHAAGAVTVSATGERANLVLHAISTRTVNRDSVRLN